MLQSQLKVNKLTCCVSLVLDIMGIQMHLSHFVNFSHEHMCDRKHNRYESQRRNARTSAQGMCACAGNVVKDTRLSPSISTSALSIVHIAFAKKRYRSALLPRPMFVASVEGVIESLTGQQVAQLIAVATWARIIHRLCKIGPKDPEYQLLPAQSSRASLKLFSLLHEGMAVGSLSS